MLRLAEGPMITLQNNILYLEETLLKEKNPGYPAFTVKVPKELVDFVQEDLADLFFIAYEDIFNLYHSKRLDYDTPYVAIVDPYYMRDSHLVEGSTTRETAKEYLVRVFLANKDKTALLLPYFFE